MTRTRTRMFAAAVLAVGLVTAACGDDTPSDDPTDSPTAAPTATTSATPTEPVAFTAGDAQVTVSGDVEEEFTASIDETDSTYDPSDGEHELLWTNEEGRALRLTITASGTTVEDAFVAIGVPGRSIDDEDYFPDAFHTQCEVTVTTASPTELEGEFTCEELESSDGEKSINAEGTFSASAS